MGQYDPKVGDWLLFWTGTAHKLAGVTSTPMYVWLYTPCGLAPSYDVDSMMLADASDRHCKRCEKVEVKRA